jgi:hypothetical protein
MQLPNHLHAMLKFMKMNKKYKPCREQKFVRKYTRLHNLNFVNE